MELLFLDSLDILPIPGDAGGCVAIVLQLDIIIEVGRAGTCIEASEPFVDLIPLLRAALLRQTLLNGIEAVNIERLLPVGHALLLHGLGVTVDKEEGVAGVVVGWLAILCGCWRFGKAHQAELDVLHLLVLDDNLLL